MRQGREGRGGTEAKGGDPYGQMGFVLLGALGDSVGPTPQGSHLRGEELGCSFSKPYQPLGTAHTGAFWSPPRWRLIEPHRCGDTWETA